MQRQRLPSRSRETSASPEASASSASTALFPSSAPLPLPLLLLLLPGSPLFALRLAAAAQAMAIPGVQKPHCDAWLSASASCTRWNLPPPTPALLGQTEPFPPPPPPSPPFSPSLVRTAAPSRTPTGARHAFRVRSRRQDEPLLPPATGASDTRTAQAPHPPSAHPTLHPVKGVLVRMKLARVSVGSAAS